MQTHEHEVLRIEESLPARWGADADALAASIQEAVRRQIGGRTPSIIAVRLGTRVPVSDEELVRALSRASRGTPLSGARLRIERVPARWFCPGCDHTLHGRKCRTCGVMGILEAGEERVLDAIETG